VPMANDPPFATLNHVAGDLGIPSESALLRVGIKGSSPRCDEDHRYGFSIGQLVHCRVAIAHDASAPTPVRGSTEPRHHLLSSTIRDVDFSLDCVPTGTADLTTASTAN